MVSGLPLCQLASIFSTRKVCPEAVWGPADMQPWPCSGHVDLPLSCLSHEAWPGLSDGKVRPWRGSGNILASCLPWPGAKGEMTVSLDSHEGPADCLLAHFAPSTFSLSHLSKITGGSFRGSGSGVLDVVLPLPVPHPAHAPRVCLSGPYPSQALRASERLAGWGEDSHLS